MSDLYLIHHGILGQKWGVRRYQNEDGTLTEAGRKRLYRDTYKKDKKNLVSLAGDVRRSNTFKKASKGTAFENFSKYSLDKDLNTYESASKEFISKYGNQKLESLKSKIGVNAMREAEELVSKRLKDNYINDTIDEHGKLKKEFKDLKNNIKNNGYKSFDAYHVPIGDIRTSIYGTTKDINEFASSIKNLQKSVEKTGLNNINNEVSNSIFEEATKYDSSNNTTLEGIKNNLKLYGISEHGSKYYELHYEHKDFFDTNNSPFGDHSLDFEAAIDENGKLKLSKYFSVNG